MASDKETVDSDEYELIRNNQEVEKIEVLVNQFSGLQGRSSQDIKRAFRKLKRIKNLGQVGSKLHDKNENIVPF